MNGCEIFVLIIVALLLPPLAVLVTDGCGFHFWLNVLLTIFGYIPGHIHAFWRICVKYEAEKPVLHSRPMAPGY